MLVLAQEMACLCLNLFVSKPGNKQTPAGQLGRLHHHYESGVRRQVRVKLQCVQEDCASITSVICLLLPYTNDLFDLTHALSLNSRCPLCLFGPPQLDEMQLASNCVLKKVCDDSLGFSAEEKWRVGTVNCVN